MPSNPRPRLVPSLPLHPTPSVEERVSTFEERNTAFGEHLRQLREAADVPAKVLAARVGWNAPKLSKLENGRQVASDEDLDVWAAGMDITGTLLEKLRIELADVREERVAWKQLVRAGYVARQEESVELEAKAKVIRAVEFGVVPGLLQTADYARHVLLIARDLFGGKDDIADAVRARMRRQQILYEPGRTLEFLVAEAALLHPIAPPDVMAGQIHRLIAMIGTPSLRLGILPVNVRLPVFPLHGYWIIDQVVAYETLVGERRIGDPDEVAIYNEVTDRLWSAAVEGDEARGVLARIATRLA